jgi:uncharacterized membrane protein HdeD (DUF308 family)
MTSPASPVRYCQFGKRFLDGFGWIAPVTNNRLGDALNIEFVHEHLFLIEGDRVLKNIGYGEKSQRFSEEDYGKPLHALEDLAKNGYWLVGRPYHPEAARDALAQQDDGYYYSFFSNQCQDWADRLQRRIERIEKERGLPALGADVRAGEDATFWQEKPPTVPGSAWLALVAIALGIGSCLAPAVAAERSVWVLAAFLIVSGLAEIGYALHGRAWSQLLGTIFFALLNLGAGVALLLDTVVVANWAGGIFGLALAVNGAARVIVALRSRPIRRWLGSLLTGLGMLISAILLFSHTVGERDAVFGLIVGFNLLLGGASTLWLRWTASLER